MTFLYSQARDLGPVVLPEWQGRDKYMMSFDVNNVILEPGFEDYEPVAEHLISSIRERFPDALRSGTIHMTVDEKIVQPGMSQRRPGAHVDGCFVPEKRDWLHGPSGPYWNHYCNHLPVARMPVVVAASVPGCIVYEGKFEGSPQNDGDLEHIRDQLGDGRMLPSAHAFLLSPDCVHESVRFQEPTKRTFIRLALPVGSIPELVQTTSFYAE